MASMHGRETGRCDNGLRWATGVDPGRPPLAPTLWSPWWCSCPPFLPRSSQA
jgi:hypothetical protein